MLLTTSTLPRTAPRGNASGRMPAAEGARAAALQIPEEFGEVLRRVEPRPHGDLLEGQRRLRQQPLDRQRTCASQRLAEGPPHDGPKAALEGAAARVYRRGDLVHADALAGVPLDERAGGGNRRVRARSLTRGLALDDRRRLDQQGRGRPPAYANLSIH